MKNIFNHPTKPASYRQDSSDVAPLAKIPQKKPVGPKA